MNQIILKTTPILKISVLFIGGLLFARYIEIPTDHVFIATVAVTIASIAMLCGIKKSSNIVNYFILLAIFLSGIIRFQITANLRPQHHIINFTDGENPVNICGRVANFPIQKDKSTQLEITTEQISQHGKLSNTCGNILVYCKSFQIYLQRGDAISCSGVLCKPRSERNPGEFNYREYLEANKIYAIMYVKHDSAIQILPAQNKKFFFTKLLNGSRNYFEYIIDRAYSGQNRALLTGLILGERSEISLDIKEAFSKIGVMHVLAVSGLHVGFIIIIFSTLFRLLRVPFQINNILTICCILFYMFIVGFMPPVVRASITSVLYLMGIILHRQSNLINLIATAALIILLINPLQLYQASFQLSFIAVVSIVYLYRILKNVFNKFSWTYHFKKFKISNYFFQLFLVSLAASCGTMPLIIFYFEKLPLMAMFINILVIPLVGIIIALGFVYAAIVFVYPPLADLIASSNDMLLTFLIEFITKLAEFPFSYIPIYGLNFFHILLIYLVLLMFFHINQKKCQKALIYILLISLNIIVWRDTDSSSRWLTVIFFDVGDGDAALIEFPDKKRMLIDGGNQVLMFNAGQRHIFPYLKRHHIKEVETILLSHPDTDHLGGIPYLLNRIPVNRVIDNGTKRNSWVFERYLTLIDSLNIFHDTVFAGERIDSATNVGMFVLHPIAQEIHGDINNLSLVVKIIYGEISFLFTGDIEHPVEQRLLRYGNLLKSNVLKVPHHGSNSSSTLNFLKLVNPKYAIISVGEFNKFNHPSPKVLDRLRSLQIQTIRTDVNGAAIFRTDGKKLERLR